MRRFACSVFVLIMSSAAALASECQQGSATPLKLISWTAENRETPLGTATDIGIKIGNSTDVEYRLLTTSVFIDDALGNHIGGWTVPTNGQIKARDQFKLELTSFGITNLPSLTATDVAITICAESAITADGEKVEF
ncbi:hypothetical protein [Devosia aurantiaca]|uniref:Uncharacterized protein n=1 Tax=Devosia aurantiaca TaxID=2714858 RepID=A0A6M1SWC6_9HYPH|nr:hypothetical protein [Devosia aurantiaca]NGP19295.1 hypothetical protein [Devosia aurantiaca]